MSDEKVLTGDDILSADDIIGCLEKVPVPEWGGVVYLRPMSALDTIRFQQALKTGGKAKDEAMVSMSQRSLSNDKGILLFEPDNIERMKAKSTAVYLRLQSKILQLNGMTRQEKTWEALRPILEEAGVDAAVIRLVESKWDTPEASAKNS